jgi:uncharacterized membrane protein YeaQ/YmgE (transglycosylase-associated protein family)
MVQPAPETIHREPDWRGRTARTQYRDSEIYQPLWSVLIGGRVVRAALLIAFLVACNAVIGWLAWNAWDAAQSTGDQALIVALVAGGLVAGWLLTSFERWYRLRRRFRF